MSDVTAITQLILHERQGRDRGWWDQMRAAFRPDSTVHLSWFTGSGAEFVKRSEAMSARGDLSVHRMAPPVVTVRGDRAHAEASASIELKRVFSSTSNDHCSSKVDCMRGAVPLDAGTRTRHPHPVLPDNALTVRRAGVAKFRLYHDSARPWPTEGPETA
ncbi:nuclear transport factor 2 family protein [Amycolatopsis sp. NPDC088138]|uniref:nuclear transport factor 2 family protein n=1 Tax=Amycolatopsis sp. NPDC088138 TaxID=3363938 RepID=UPI0037FECBEB